MLRLSACFLIGLIVYLCPQPDALQPEAWRLLAIFVGTISGIILRPFPMGAVALIGLCTAIFTHTLNIQNQALTGFSSSVIWLVIIVFFIARAIVKTNFGIRMAYHFVSLFGKNTLSLGYALSFTEFFIAPFVPSNTARAGGIMFPIMKSIAETMGSKPDDGTAEKVGSFLMVLGYQTNVLTGALFLTSSASNSIIQSFAAAQNITISWTTWFLAALVPGLLSLFTMPFVVYKLNKPTVTKQTNTRIFAQEKLRELGPLSVKEKITIGIFLLMLSLWIMEPILKINATTVSLIGLSLCLLTNILTIEDILSEKEAWHTLIWLSTLVTMSSYLQKFGVISWFAGYLSYGVSGLAPLWVLIALPTLYFYLHYFFAGNMAQVTAMYAAFLSVSITAGASPLLSALILGFFSSLYSCLTHYGSSSAPIYFSSGYTSFKVWWTVGFVLSLVYLVIWFGVGMLWWKILGVY